jgi:hypothetical protein
MLIKIISAPVYLHQDELTGKRTYNEFNRAVRTAPASVHLFEPENIDYMDLRYNLEIFLEKLPNISKDERDGLLAEARELSDAGIDVVYQKIKSMVMGVVKLEWERRLEDFINGNPPPPKYKDYNGTGSPIEFLEEVWGKYLDRGVLYQYRLFEHDDKIVKAIYNYWDRNGRAPGDRLPLPKKMRTNAVLQQVADGGPYEVEDVVRAVRALDRRTQRQPGRNHDLG